MIQGIQGPAPTTAAGPDDGRFATLRGYGEHVFDFLSRTLERGAAGKHMPLLPLGS